MTTKQQLRNKEESTVKQNTQLNNNQWKSKGNQVFYKKPVYKKPGFSSAKNKKLQG